MATYRYHKVASTGDELCSAPSRSLTNERERDEQGSKSKTEQDEATRPTQCPGDYELLIFRGKFLCVFQTPFCKTGQPFTQPSMQLLHGFF